MQDNQIEKINKYSEASGSMSVVDSNIQMELNEYGLFEETLVDSQKSISDTAKSVSPNFNPNVNESILAEKYYSHYENITYDQRLGYYDSLYVGHVTEGDYRENASSGGIGTWIFKELFEKGLIDYVIHVKKNDKPESQTMFKYEISSTLEEIKEGAKTRYYPVELSEVMRKVKNQPGRYAIVGIPSFIYSVRLLAEADEVINERIKYTIGLICGHQKSTKFAESMAWQVGIQPGNLVDIDFRHKLLDRPASSYGVKMTGYIDDELQTIIKPKSELFGQNWGWGFFKPEASNYTDDVFNETADIVIGDAWLPEYTADSKGNNVVIVRHPLISQLINDAVSEDRLKMDIVNNETVFASQASHYRHTHDELVYRLYKKQQKNEWVPQKRVEPSENISNTRRKIQDLRTHISEQSHIQYQEAVKHDDFDYFINQMNDYTKEYKELYEKIRKRELAHKVMKMNPKELVQKIVKRFKN